MSTDNHEQPAQIFMNEIRQKAANADNETALDGDDVTKSEDTSFEIPNDPSHRSAIAAAQTNVSRATLGKLDTTLRGADASDRVMTSEELTEHQIATTGYAGEYEPRETVRP